MRSLVKLIALTLFFVGNSHISLSSYLADDQQYFSSFQTRLRNTYATWSWDDQNTVTYYRYVPSQPSKIPTIPVAGFIVVKIKVNNENIDVTANLSHTFTVAGFPLRVDLSRLSMWENDRQDFPVVVNYKNDSLDIDWTYKEEKVPTIKEFSNIQGFIDAIPDSWWRRKIVATGNVSPTPHLREELALEISAQYSQKHPLDCKGMAISYNRDRHKTAIFFDLVDSLGQEGAKYLSPHTPDSGNIELIDHKKMQTTKKNVFWVAVPDGQIWEYQAQKIVYSIFEGDQERSRWVLAGQQFTKCPGTGVYAPLPTQYKNDDNQGKLSQTKTVAILTKLDPGKHYTRLPGKQQVNSDYLYIDGHDKFFPTHCIQEQWQELSASIQNNPAPFTVTYLQQAELELRKANVVCTPNGKWQQGVYKLIGKNVTRDITRETWKLEDSDIEKTIEFETNTIEQSFYFPAEGLLNQLNQQTVKTIQMFNPIRHIKFPQRIDRLNDSICASLSGFRKITELNLSKTKLESNLKWPIVYERIGFLTGLTSLDLSFNDLYYQSFGELLVKLNNLTTLKLQGEIELLDRLNPPGRNCLCAILARTTPKLCTLHIDNLPGEASYSYMRIIGLPATVILDSMTSWAPGPFIATTATNLASLPQLKSLTLYQKNGDSWYNYSKQEDLENKIREIALRNGKNNLQIRRVNL